MVRANASFRPCGGGHILGADVPRLCWDGCPPCPFDGEQHTLPLRVTAAFQHSSPCPLQVLALLLPIPDTPASRAVQTSGRQCCSLPVLSSQDHVVSGLHWVWFGPCAPAYPASLASSQGKKGSQKAPGTRYKLLFPTFACQCRCVSAVLRTRTRSYSTAAVSVPGRSLSDGSGSLADPPGAPVPSTEHCPQYLSHAEAQLCDVASLHGLAHLR